MELIECVNCKSTRDLKTFYIVELQNGGLDEFPNKINLCSSCFKDSIFSKIKGVGRPSIGSAEDFKDTLKDWFNCKIGTKEAKERIGLPVGNQSTWNRLRVEYMQLNGIVDNRNNIDIINAKGYTTDILGYIKYKDKDKTYINREGNFIYKNK